MKPYEFQKHLYSGESRLNPTETAICAYLSWRAVKDGRAIHGWCVESTQSEISGAVGATREWVNKCIGQLERAGWLKVERPRGPVNIGAVRRIADTNPYTDGAYMVAP